MSAQPDSILSERNGVKQPQELLWPDISWIKKNVSVLAVGRELGMVIHKKRARCWRPENHTHGDADPSLHFYERGNRVRCFICDMRGGYSCIDLVMGVLGIQFGDAVRWIAERFIVPSVKVGRPVGSRPAELAPYRVGVQGSELEVLVRSGVFGRLSAAERSILVTLAIYRDPETGLTRISYAAIARYAGVASRTTISTALKQLARLRAIGVHRAARVGITRECNAYRVTLDDPKFLQVCNETFRITAQQVAQEREYRAYLRKERRALRPSSSSDEERGKASTCKGLNLSTPDGLVSNKSVHGAHREIRISADSSAKGQIAKINRSRLEKGLSAICN
jgi:hypothetical protein